MSFAVPLSAEELLTQQFYNWEIRGRGWAVWDNPVDLEPPFRPFEGHTLPSGLFRDDGRQDTLFSGLANRLAGLLRNRKSTPLDTDEITLEEPEPEFRATQSDLIELHLSLPRESKPLPDVFEQCLFSLAYSSSAIAFEVIGNKDSLIVQVVCQRCDANNVFSQLKNHFPDAVITPAENFLTGRLSSEHRGHIEIREFGLEREFMLPLKSAKELAVDPMVTVCGALEQLYENEVALLQVLFQPTRNRWAENAWSALTTNEGDPFFTGEREMLAPAKRKLASPLLAVVVRIAARAENEKRTWEIVRGMAGVLRVFDEPTGNRLMLLENDDYDEDDHYSDLLMRCSQRSGMLLSSEELISIAHLPTAAVCSRKLAREIKRTKAAPEALTKSGVWLGVNKHEGKKTVVRLPDASRVEHMHVLGTQGTGKSTLLLNLICQDIYNGRGIAVLDPHGDLIDDVLAYIPPERYRDVILVDPSDELYPIGFNILSAHSTIEKNLLASDLVAVFRRLSTSWGDQMSSVLGNAVLAFLENKRVGTLPEMRRFFVESAFRKEMLETVTDPDVVYYWEKEFPLLKSNSLGPLLTRLDMFLRPKTIRYMVGQRENKLDFAGIMNEGKILLARLSEGIIGEENGFLLGTLLVSKFHQLAISRQAMESGERRPFFLYIDEFHHYVTPSMASILTGVRKYRLGLILAHQNITQLRDADVADAVLSSPYARVCFRVGDHDAKRVAESLAFFEPSDILNLGKGEAICRVQKNDWDFNLETIVPPKPEPEQAKHRRQYLQYLTRLQYGMPREQVEEELAKSRFEPTREPIDPFQKRTSSERPRQKKGDKAATVSVQSTEPPEKPIVKDEELERIEKFYAKPESTPPPSSATNNPSAVLEPTPIAAINSTEHTRNTIAEMGRGGAQHQTIQSRIKEAAQSCGLRASIDDKNHNRGSQADVVIERNGVAWACQIVTASNSIDHEFGQVRKCFRAGFENVIVVGINLPFLKKLEGAVGVSLGAQVAKHVSYFLPDEFIEHIPKLALTAPPKPLTTQSYGYNVTVETVTLSPEETKVRTHRAFQAYADSIKKKRRKK